MYNLKAVFVSTDEQNTVKKKLWVHTMIVHYQKLKWIKLPEISENDFRVLILK